MRLELLVFLQSKITVLSLLMKQKYEDSVTVATAGKLF